MSDKERLQLEQECLLKYSKAQMIEKYIDEFEENIKLSELWCKSQQENKQLKEDKKKTIEYIRSNEWAKDYEISNCRTHLLEMLGDKENEI